MTLTAFSFIFCSIFLHVGWNFLCKTTRKPSMSFYLALNFISAIALLPFLFLAKFNFSQLNWHFWIQLAFSGFFETLYAYGLFKSYSYNDISLVYPLARALPVIFMPIVTIIFKLGERPSYLALFGMLVVAIGCIILPQPSLKKIRLKTFLNKSMLPICIAAVGTTGYTIMDNLATSQVFPLCNSPKIIASGAYLCIAQFAIFTGILIYLLLAHTESPKTALSCFRLPSAYMSGIFSCLAYFLVLCAMPHVTNISYLQAFRQMSLPLAVAAGVWLLKEKMTYTKIIGTITIVIGLYLTII